jgi:hypothetical protein
MGRIRSHVKTGNPMGRPPKISTALIAAIAKTVAGGNYLDTAARLHGVDRVTFHHWMKKGHAQKRGLYRDFLNSLEQAQAEADSIDHGFIRSASGKDWKAAAEHLRLRNQSRYGRSRVEVSGPEGRPIQVESSVAASLMETFRKLAGEDTPEEKPE